MTGSDSDRFSPESIIASSGPATMTLPPVPELGPEIHVWALELEAIGDVPLCSPLSADEVQRASRFHFAADRRRFAAARSCLRHLLAAYTQQDAARLEFCYSRFGKPSLSAPATDVAFNVSHSQDLALLAFARGRKIGVDVEYVRPEVETESLAQRFFSPHERAAICGLSAEAKVNAFFRCWTCKEAFLKAQGFGLSVPLDGFDVSVLPDQPAAVLATRPDIRELERWSIWTLKVAPGYAAAVVTERCNQKPQLLHWKPSFGR